MTSVWLFSLFWGNTFKVVTDIWWPDAYPKHFHHFSYSSYELMQHRMFFDKKQLFLQQITKKVKTQIFYR